MIRRLIRIQVKFRSDTRVAAVKNLFAGNSTRLMGVIGKFRNKKLRRTDGENTPIPRLGDLRAVVEVNRTANNRSPFSPFYPFYPLSRINPEGVKVEHRVPPVCHFYCPSRRIKGIREEVEREVTGYRTMPVPRDFKYPTNHAATCIAYGRCPSEFVSNEFTRWLPRITERYREF